MSGTRGRCRRKLCSLLYDLSGTRLLPLGGSGRVGRYYCHLGATSNSNKYLSYRC
jgi:hypothetical protein